MAQHLVEEELARRRRRDDEALGVVVAAEQHAAPRAAARHGHHALAAHGLGAAAAAAHEGRRARQRGETRERPERERRAVRARRPRRRLLSLEVLALELEGDRRLLSGLARLVEEREQILRARPDFGRGFLVGGHLPRVAVSGRLGRGEAGGDLRAEARAGAPRRPFLAVKTLGVFRSQAPAEELIARRGRVGPFEIGRLRSCARAQLGCARLLGLSPSVLIGTQRGL